MSVSESHVKSLLSGLKVPYLDDDPGQAGVITNLGIVDDKVALTLRLGYPTGTFADDLAKQARELLLADPGIGAATIAVESRIAAHKVQDKLSPLPGVRNIIAVASGKGGVGKSTTTVNLALALTRAGARVGILDADIYGPSQPRMMGLSGRPDSPDGHTISPKVNYGVQTMSIGYLIEEDTPMVWRGPMVTQALQQLITDTAWEDLDYLFVDMPPGTGDIQLTLAQRVPLSGSIIVTTPQDIALLDARKGLRMFQKVHVPVLGIVENMSTHICSQCGHEEHIFGTGGGQRMADDYEVNLLGSLPLDLRIREQTDGGKPTVVKEPNSAIAQAYMDVALKAASELARQSRNKKIDFPNIVIQNT